MRLIRGFLFFVATLLIFSALPGYAADLSAVIATLEQDYNALSDVQAAFSQKTTIASIKREERGKGELFIKKGSGAEAMFRFDYEKPRQQIVSDGKQVWYYLPDNKQVMVSDVKALFAGGNGMALNYLTGLGHVSRDFKISFAKEGQDRKGNYVLDLVPKKPNQVMTRLRLTIAAQAVEQFRESGKPLALFPVIESAMDDPYGNRTVIEFSR
ncbi:MAG TPA: outer membrane lipoprotein carrier protein LolA, partial [Geobacteraceae bacterium]